MRHALAACLVVSVSLMSSGTAQAQRVPRVKIEHVRYGFPAGIQPDGETGDWESTPLFKLGVWTPVYISLTAGPQGFKKDEAQVVVESADSDEVVNNYSVPVPPVEKNETFTVLAYTKPGSAEKGITVRVLIEGQNICRPYEKTPTGLDTGETLYLTVGSRLPWMRRALRPEQDKETLEKDRMVYVDHVDQLPESWYGYAAIDLLILTTGEKREFLEALLNNQNERINRKREALAEWVRRGGRLLLSVGRNQDVVSKIPDWQAMLPMTIAGTIAKEGLPAEWGVRNARDLQPVDLVKLEPKPGKVVRVLRRLDTGVPEKDESPLIVQAPYGQGKVTLVAFDLDQRPFTAWGGQQGFWKPLLAEAGYSDDRGSKIAANDVPVNPWGASQQNMDLQYQLQTNLEDYGDEVPVISFGWVALFILLYILVVGPLDYLFLKKVMNRLELTWITFPTVVLLVSATAYFTAYWLKGNDLKINKIDSIDIDLGTKQSYGTTWFTLFSPRIQHYTIGLEPAAPDWAPSGGDPKDHSVVVTWLGRPDANRPRGQSLFRRAYDYEPNAAGLRGVPIQVWSTKSFTACWQAPIDPARPLFTANIQRLNPNLGTLTGEITSGLPIQLEDAVLIYHHTNEDQLSVFNLGALQPGAVRKIDTVVQDFGKGWLRNPTSQATSNQNVRYRRGGFYQDIKVSTDAVVKTLLFHDSLDHPGQGGLRNLSGRLLDQTWRLKQFRNEAIVYGRLAAPPGSAESVAQGPMSPSRLWLGDQPALGKTRPSLAGTLRQETYVRIFIPIQSKP